MSDLPMPSAGRNPNGDPINMESPYEQGFYFGLVGIGPEENPFARKDKLNFRLWLKGWAEATRLTSEYHARKKP